MKVLNLRCANGHGFEGWFASEEDFLSQNGSGRIECPLCADTVISRMPSAPRLNLAHARPSDAASQPTPPASGTCADLPAPQAAELQALWLRAVRHVMANTEDVGTRFAEEARRIHHGESERRGIRGEATPEDAQALAEEGIDVAVLPIPQALKEPLQ